MKLGIRVSPRSVRRYMGRGLGGGGQGATGHRCATIVRNHTQALAACDICVALAATIRVL